MMFVPQKRSALEILDLPPGSYGADELDGTLADIRLVNRYLGDRRALLKHLARLVGKSPAFTVLDIATGSADLPMDMVDWARKQGKTVAITAVDNNPRTVEIARRQAASYAEIELAVADAFDLPFPDKSFDFIICSKTTHHFSDEEVVRLIREMMRLSRRGYMIMDLRRSWIAYALITILTRIFTRNRLTRNDGPLSVLKAFTPGELAALARRAGAANFSLAREPFWLLVLTGEVA